MVVVVVDDACNAHKCVSIGYIRTVRCRRIQAHLPRLEDEKQQLEEEDKCASYLCTLHTVTVSRISNSTRKTRNQGVYQNDEDFFACGSHLINHDLGYCN